MNHQKTATISKLTPIDLHIQISDPAIIRYLKKYPRPVEEHVLEILRVGVCALESSNPSDGDGAVRQASEGFAPKAGRIKNSSLGDDERLCKCRKDLEDLMDEYAEKWY
jgi:hypothetical protein